MRDYFPREKIVQILYPRDNNFATPQYQVLWLKYTYYLDNFRVFLITTPLSRVILILNIFLIIFFRLFRPSLVVIFYPPPFGVKFETHVGVSPPLSL